MSTRTFPLILAALASVSLCACSDAGARPITGSSGAASTPVMDMSTTGGGHIASFVSNGAFGDLSDFTAPEGAPATFTNLSVQKGGTISSPTTFLEYDVSQCTEDPTTATTVCTDVLEGVGTIPNEDFTGSESNLHLHTNTATNPNFLFLAGSGGEVDVTWRKTDLFMTRISETSDNTRDGILIHTTGHGEFMAAHVVATIAGVSLSAGVTGEMGTSHSTTVYHFAH
ncbi:MAG TPA: hypothetical protein VN677_10475 [Gemmatimonadaceae bacterium]|jgi:hypothetical protein|nr:hypothetical protein [Gemmatimonadaceae bacterium]